MGVHRFARTPDDMQSKLSHKQGRKSITDEVKISKFLNNMPYIIKKSITAHLSHDITHNDIVTKSQQFEAANRGANEAYTKRGYPSMLSIYTNKNSTRASYTTQPSRPAKDQQPENCLATSGARSTASSET